MLKSDSNKSRVVFDAGECGLRGGRVSGGVGGGWWCWRRPQIMQLLLIHTRAGFRHAERRRSLAERCDWPARCIVRRVYCMSERVFDEEI